MSGIEARLRHRLRQFVLDAAFEAPNQGVTALFGRSGSGKTTLLRCLAGLVQAEGVLRINGATWQDSEAGVFVPTHRRPLGYVFQDRSLFPHLSVRRNLEYGLKRLPLAERRVRFEEAVTLLGVAPLLSRTPQQLSGGQGQRVAIARALLASPRLLLMDEPLASLDLASKSEILPYLQRLPVELSIPVIYVTHSPDEVSRLADHLVLLEHGRVRAAGRLLELLTRLDLPLVHEDATAIVEGTVAEHDAGYHLTWVEFPGGRLTVPLADYALGHRVRLRIHARDVSLALERNARTSILNILPARVIEVVAEDAAQLLVKLDLTGTVLLARITRRSGDMLGIAPGLRVYAQLKSVALVD